MSKVSVKPIRNFRDHESGEFVGPGETIEVSATRAVELRQNGLIEDYDMKQEPENKQTPEPANKAAAKGKNKSSAQPEPEQPSNEQPEQV